MEKISYESPKTEIIYFGSEDVIRTSPDDIETPDYATPTGSLF